MTTYEFDNPQSPEHYNRWNNKIRPKLDKHDVDYEVVATAGTGHLANNGIPSIISIEYDNKNVMEEFELYYSKEEDD